MAAPFAADSWVKRTSVPPTSLNGVYSGIVQGLEGASYDAVSRTIQVFSKTAHHFNGFANIGLISFDDGQSWTHSFNPLEDVGLNERVIAAWSLPHPAAGELDPTGSVVLSRLHYQVRVAWQHAFLVFDGSVPSPGGMSLWVSEGGSSFFKLQDLHTWPQINQIGGNLGRNALQAYAPTATPPILLEGSGPDGEDAYWFISSYQHDGGGAGNLTVFKAATLWRSIDSGVSWEAVRDMAPVTGETTYTSIQKSTSGRLLVVTGGGGVAGGIAFTDDDLLTGAFTSSNFSGAAGIRGPLMPMYGGTWFTFSQGTLTGPGSAWISCDDAENFDGSDALIPQNKAGYGVKLGPTEALVVAPGFNDPATETAAYYSDSGGEEFIISDPWISSSTGEQPVFIGIRRDGTPIVITSSSGVYVSRDKARGTASVRTVCPLANAGLAPARRLILCGGVITPDCQES